VQVNAATAAITSVQLPLVTQTSQSWATEVLLDRSRMTSMLDPSAGLLPHCRLHPLSPSLWRPTVAGGRSLALLVPSPGSAPLSGDPAGTCLEVALKSHP
jgi:hypothetical protein